jgi:hypothetical protein
MLDLLGEQKKGTESLVPRIQRSGWVWNTYVL